MLRDINNEENKKRPDLSSLINEYKDAVETFREGDYTSKGRTFAYHTMKNLAPLVEQELKNRGSSSTTSMAGEYGLEEQNLRNLGQIEQTRESSAGAMNLQELADANAMIRQKAKDRESLRRIGATRDAEMDLQLDRYVGESEENRRKRNAELRKPIFQPATDKTGMPIDYVNINTPEQRRRGTAAGTFDTSDEDFFFGRDRSSNFLDLD
jgi:hypothetical protein